MSGRVIAGIILLVLGIGFLAEVLTDVDFGSWLADWWPLILVFIGGVQLVTRSAPTVISIILLVVGAVLLVWQVFDVSVDLWSLIVAIVLISVGLSLIVPRLFGRGSGVSTSDDLRYFVAFGGREESVQATAFRGGSITSMFGGVELDLRGSRLALEGAAMEVISLFGGVEITVPDTWHVEITGTPLFGGWENKTRTATAPAASATLPPPHAAAPPTPTYPLPGTPTAAWTAEPAASAALGSPSAPPAVPGVEGTVRFKAFVMFGGFEVHN